MRVRGGPALKLRIVPFADLEAHLPTSIQQIDAAGRTAQLGARKAAFARRIDYGEFELP